MLKLLGAVLLVLGIIWVIAANQGRTVIYDDLVVDQGSVSGGLQNFGSGATQSSREVTLQLSTPTATAEPSPTTEPTPTRQPRRLSKDSPENKIRFESGEEVVGYRIEYDFDGTAITVARECYDPHPHVAGWVLDGVVWPDPGEFEGKPQCEPVAWGGPESETGSSDEGSGFNPLRRVTGEGSGPFSTGEPIAAGYVEYSDGKVADGPCYDPNPYTGGTIYGGVVYPEPDETNIAVCSPYWKQAEQPAPEPVYDPRRPSGDGQTIRFEAGEPVVGAYIDYDGDLAADNCYDPSPDSGGWVTSGVVYPWEGEKKSECSPYIPQPDPPPAPEPEPEPENPLRQETGEGSLWFASGTPVLGAYMKLDDPDGRVFEYCYMIAPHSGTVHGGVIYPNQDEINAHSACNTTVAEAPPVEEPPAEEPTDGLRQETGEGSLTFGAGTPVLGAYMQLDSPDGRVFEGCYMIAPHSGTVYGGVIYPNQDEINAHPPCQ